MTVDERRARQREYDRRWRADNLEKARALNRTNKRRAYERDPEHAKALARAHRRRYPGRGHTKGGFAGVLRKDPCSYCGAPAEHIDHIVPRSLGGEDHHQNFTAACASCNARKSDKSLLRFLLDKAPAPVS